MSLVQGGTNGDDTGYEIAKSVRFRAGGSAYLSRSIWSSANRKTWKAALWVKRGTIGTEQVLLGAYDGSSAWASRFYFTTSNALAFDFGYAAQNQLLTTAVFRDPSAWYFIELEVDMTQAQAAHSLSDSRIRIKVNGVQQSTSGVMIAQNTDTMFWINGQNAFIGRRNTEYLDGYLAEIVVINGGFPASPNFGQTDPVTGQWTPKKYTGTYGANGFYLPFNVGTSLTTLCEDRSGNGNNWTANNVSLTAGATYDWMDDTPTNSFATLNPLDKTSGVTLTEASLKWTGGTPYNTTNRSAFSVSSGKWYWEVTPTSTGQYTMVGVADALASITNIGRTTANGWYYAGLTGNKWNGSAVAYGATFTTNDVIGVALDLDAGTLTFYKNNTSQGQAFSGLTGKELSPVLHDGAADTAAVINFGQRPFAYTPPTGFKALCTKNLPTPTGAAAEPKKHFDVLPYVGTGAARSVTGGQFTPDFVWIKARSDAYYHRLVDSVRGVGRELFSNDVSIETLNDANGYVSAFNTDGFSVAGGGVGVNASTKPYTTWLWKAGGAAVTNTAGTITSQVSANPAAGFSIVTYTGNGLGSQTVGHGLGIKPKLIIEKGRTGGAYNWSVQNDGSLWTPTTSALNLNSNGGLNPSQIPNSPPTTTVYTPANAAYANVSGSTYVTYCFAEVEGFSKIGTYTGNGSADGPFVWCGFRPRFVMIKNVSTSGDWSIYDSARDTYNVMPNILFPNLSNVETGGYAMDFLANGFKLRSSTASNANTNGQTYIFMAFAEAPFKYANAR